MPPLRAPVLFALLAAAACEKASDSDAPPSASEPEAVVVTVSMPSLGTALADLRNYVNAIRPGGGLMLSEGMIASGLARAAGAQSLLALDFAGPVHLLVLDNPTRAVVVAKVRDREALNTERGSAHVVIRDGWALVGPKDAVELVSGWAVPGLVAAKTASDVEATVRVDRLMTRHAAAVTEMRQQAATQLSATDPGGAAMMTEYMNGLVALAGDSARVVVTLGVEGETADLDIALVPKPSSPLAGFVAAQKPSDFSLLGSLPADAPKGMLMAGHMELGPYRASALAMFVRMMNFGDDTATFLDAFTQLANLATGDFAAGFTMGAGGSSMVEILPVSDAAAAARAVGKVAAATASGKQVTAMGIRMTHTGHPDVASHDGAPIHGITTTVDLDSVPPIQRDMFARMYGSAGQVMHIGFPQGALLAVIGDLDHCKHAIDARAGKVERLRLSSDTAAQFQAARARKDSLAFVVDLVSLIGGLRSAVTSADPSQPPPVTAPGLAVSLGFADKSAHLHFTLAAATFRAVASLAAPPP
jgi:hypothetical protein